MTTTFLYKHDQTAVVYPEEKASIAVNKNSPANLPESICYFNATYIQGLREDCQNGTIIRKLLSNPSMTHNISYVNDVIPYFSDVRVYFDDGTNNCTNRFKEFIKAKNNTLTNIDIYNFLTNDSICWEFAFFINQLCVEFQLNRYNEVRLSLEVRKHSHMPIYLSLKHQLCTDEFIQYVYRNGLYMGSNDTFILNIDNIINFTQENSCLDIYFLIYALYDRSDVYRQSNI
ncbi:unnamed protein product [Mytilus edulis]|uniref:Uncharacterized protein n=1 Tax=Mytilus edulis TaxID=6550 RepID=A0A8S3RI13_MYTED|nr:unnamed protein product [Mytilus edulis]